MSEGAIRIGVLGLGSVFYGPYMGMVERLASAGRARVTAVYDVDEGKRRAAGQRLGVDAGLTSAEAVIEGRNVYEERQRGAGVAVESDGGAPAEEDEAQTAEAPVA